MSATTQAAAIAKLREPFPEHQISKLPKESKAQSDQRKADRNSAINCKVCGGWHHKNAVHLDYVGHAALTDRLLDTDIAWTWEPLALTPEGLPAFDRTNGLWIKLTVCGMTRIGYGSADGKTGGDAVKEIIGDALRNAAMRFGAALDLWHKGDLHLDDGDTATAANVERHNDANAAVDEIAPPEGWGDWARAIIATVAGADTPALDKIVAEQKQRINAVKKIDATMHKAIGDAFAARRAVLADDVPF